MTPKNTTIYVVEDDASFRKSFKRLLKALGFKVMEFDSAASFLDQTYLQRPSCLILDVNLPQMDGLALQEELLIKGINIPVIFITGHRDAAKSAKAMKNGAIDFLQKPFSVQEINRAISLAIKSDAPEVENKT